MTSWWVGLLGVGPHRERGLVRGQGKGKGLIPPARVGAGKEKEGVDLWETEMGGA